MKVVNLLEDQKGLRLPLATLLCDYFKETLKDNYRGSLEEAKNLVDILLSLNNYIYLVLDDDKVVGFVTMYVFNQYGMSKEYLVVDHMYVVPDYRGSRTTLWLYTTIAKVMTDLDIDGVGTTYTTSANKHNNTLVSGEVIAEVTKVSLEDIKGKYKKYLKGLKCV